MVTEREQEQELGVEVEVMRVMPAREGAGWPEGWRERPFAEMSEAQVERWFGECILFYCGGDGGEH